LADHFAEEGAGDEEEAGDAEEAAKNIGAGGEGRMVWKRENAGGPGLGFAGDGGREEYGDVSIPGDDGEFHVVGIVRGELGGIFAEARGFEAADDDTGVGDENREGVKEEIFAGDAVRRDHGRRGNCDDACGTKFGGDAQGDGSAKGVAGNNGATGNDHAARGESTEERNGAGFGLLWRERAGGLAVARKIGDEDAEAKFGEGAGEVLHDDAVGGESVEENDGAGFRAGGVVGAVKFDQVHAAGGRVDDVAVLGVTARGIKGQKRSDDQAQDTGNGLKDLIFLSQARGSRKKRSAAAW
jgi:hypothetical protein